MSDRLTLMTGAFIGVLVTLLVIGGYAVWVAYAMPGSVSVTSEVVLRIR